jgi:geranylgeranyl pyrophosphate synthase
LNSTISFFIPVQEQIRQVEQLMRSQADNHHPDLQAAIDHLLASGGKRIRPTLTLLVGRMLGGDESRLITLAAAIELLHTATLVHDDLIDGSLLRRGIPTINSRWSPGATVLTGDFMFARAAKLASDTNSIPVMSLFSKTLAIIVNGEITQLFSSRCNFDRQQYFQRIYSKTASLFEASACCAALISDLDEEIVENVRLYGYDIGMAFQIVDDVFDFTSNQTVLGKPVGSDLRQGLVTLPVIHYFEANPEDEDIRALVDGECYLPAERLNRLVEKIRQSPAIEQALSEAGSFVDSALHRLQKLPANPARSHLEELTRYITQRHV